MKFFNAIVCFMLYFLVSFDVQAKKGDDYLENIHAQIAIVQADLVDYVTTIMPTKGAENAEQVRLNSLKRLKSVKQSMSEIERYKSDSGLRDSVLKSILIYEQILRDDGDQLVDFESTAERAFDDMNVYLTLKISILSKLTQVVDQFYQAENQFIKRNNIQFDLAHSQKIKMNLEKIALVYDYYFDVYRIFFKSNVLETYLIMSVVSRKIDQIEYQRELLLTSAKRGLEKLEKMNAFQDDSTLVKMCVRVLKYYKEEAESEFPSLHDYCLAEKEFNAKEKEFLGKGENYSLEELEKFDSAKSDFKILTDEFFITIERTNLFRVDRLTDWEEAGTEFLLNYLPKNFN